MLVAILFALQLIDNISAAPAFSTSTTLESRGPSISVPGCAASCVQNSIQQSFPTSVCADQQDLSCLCTSPSLTGYTIGEEILQCLLSNCQEATSDQLSQGYSICNSIPNAVQPTHATITANIPTETTIFAQPAASTSASITSSAAGSSPSATSLTTSTSIVQRASVSPTSSSTASAATSTPTVTPVLTNTQLIGLTVGLGVLALIAMALLTYVCCFRRRNRPDSSLSQSFTTTQPLIPQVETGTIPTTSNASQTYPYMPSKAQAVLGQKFPVWSPATSSNVIYPSYQGITATPRPDERSNTPGSAVTYQTTSNLLPEKPSYQAPLRPLRDGSEGALLTVPSTRRTRGSPSTFQASPDSFNSGPIVHRKPSDPFLQAPEPLYSPSRGADHERSARMNLPRLNTKTVQFALDPTSTALPPPPPIAPYNPASYAYFAETQVPDWRTTPTPPADNSRRVPALVATSIPPQELTATTFKPVPPPKEKATFNKFKPIPPSKAPVAASTVTSFESEDNEYGEPVPLLPPLPIWRKPVTTSASQNDSRYQYRFEPQQSLGSSSSNTAATTATSLSQVQYPTIPATSAKPAPKLQPVHPFIAKNRQQEQQQPRSRDSPQDVSPLTPQTQRKDPVILPPWNQDLLGLTPSPTVASRTVTTIAYNRPFQYEQNTGASSSRQAANPYPYYDTPLSPASVDVSQLLDQGFVELPDRNSIHQWTSTAASTINSAHESKKNISSSAPRKMNPATSRSPAPEPAIDSTPQRTRPAAMMLIELPSPDAERLIDPLSQTSELKSPKGQSRGARLGAAMANKSPQARPRGASDGNVQGPPQPTQRPRHTRAQSSVTGLKLFPTYNPPRPLNEIGLEPAARRNLQSGRNSPLRPGPASSARGDVNGNLRGTAKYTVLLSSGQN